MPAAGCDQCEAHEEPESPHRGAEYESGLVPAYDQLSGARRHQLERQLDRIEDLRTDQALSLNDPERRLVLEA
jgi:hypothetical protein